VVGSAFLLEEEVPELSELALEEFLLPEAQAKNIIVERDKRKARIKIKTFKASR
jgi:hypothetical protein